MTTPAPKFRLALCQIPVTANKQANLKTASDYLHEAKTKGASLAVLPECFNCPYDTACFGEYAERLPDTGNTKSSAPGESPSLDMLRNTAMETGMYIVGGSIPERDDSGSLYNTSLTVSPAGNLLAKHRKAHMFDIDVPGGIKFTESSVLSPGNKATVFRAEGLDICLGVSICYDVRFPEFCAVQARQGAQLLILPGAFNMTTGPAHWSLLMRGRAVDNQVFFAACSPARAVGQDGYQAWGHSMVVDPWGTVIASTEEKPDVIVADVDLARLHEVRQSVPTSKQRRDDIYELRSEGRAFQEE